MKKRILFLTLHRQDRSPGQRFRHEQYLEYLEANGFEITYSNMLNSEQDKVFYGSGNTLKKAIIGIDAMFTRIRDLFRANRYDYVFVYRDAFFFGILFEWLFKQTKAKLIFDFDDSIWLQDENPSQSFFQKLKNPAKTGTIISYCDLIVAGNEYLADYAKGFNKNVVIVPTTIDTNQYQWKETPKSKEGVCIGWSGSFSTIKHFESALEPLKQLKAKYAEHIYFKVIGDGSYTNEELDVKGLTWKSATEVSDLCEINIGIMPLPDDDWSRGKCGLKGLQYMALGIPTIMSPVGVNADIIQDGVNGMLAATTEEWVAKLSQLIEDAELRMRIGEAGKQTVIKDFSVEANKEKWLGVFGD